MAMFQANYHNNMNTLTETAMKVDMIFNHIKKQENENSHENKEINEEEILTRTDPQNP